MADIVLQDTDGDSITLQNSEAVNVSLEDNVSPAIQVTSANATAPIVVQEGTDVDVFLEDTDGPDVTISATVNGRDGADGPAGPAGPQGPPGADGQDGLGVPAGGTTGQVLAKASNADNDTTWSTVAGTGATDHGTLTGLADDDHTQYHTDARGDARYYTKSQVDTSLTGKANTTHSHATSDVTGLDTALAGKAASTHSHATADVTGLDTALAGKAASSHTHGIADLTATGTADATTYLRGDGTWSTPAGGGGGVTDHGALTGLADDDHTQYHNDTRGDIRYYQKTEVDTALGLKANLAAPSFTGNVGLGSYGHAKSITNPDAEQSLTLEGTQSVDIQLGAAGYFNIYGPGDTTSPFYVDANGAASVSTPSAATHATTKQYVDDAIAAVQAAMQLPVGSLYMNRTNSANPSTYLGYGTWTAITDKMIMARGSTYTADGGSATHTHPLSSAGGVPFALSSSLSKVNRNGPATSVASGNDQSGMTWGAGTGTITTSLGLIGNTDSGSNIPPNIVAYVWERTA